MLANSWIMLNCTRVTSMSMYGCILASDWVTCRNAFRRYEDLRVILARMHNVVSEVNDRFKPPTIRPPPILPTLPLPKPSRVPVPSIHVSDEQAFPTHHNASSGNSKSATDALLSPSGMMLDTAPVSATLLPADPPSSAPSTKAAPAFLQNSSAIQEELSAQLAQMATQLKRNAQHFSESLEKDKALVQETQEKLQHNHDVMSKERVRVRDHHSKSWGTTWLVMLSVVVALVGFILTFFVIRLT